MSGKSAKLMRKKVAATMRVIQRQAELGVPGRETDMARQAVERLDPSHIAKHWRRHWLTVSHKQRGKDRKRIERMVRNERG